MEYVYLGNISGNRYEDTRCPGCGSVTIERSGFHVRSFNLAAGNTCRACGRNMRIEGKVTNR